MYEQLRRAVKYIDKILGDTGVVEYFEVFEGNLADLYKARDGLTAIEAALRATPHAVPVSVSACQNCGKTISQHSELMYCPNSGAGTSMWATTQYAHPVTPTPDHIPDTSKMVATVKESLTVERVRKALQTLVDLEDRNNEGMRSSAPTSAEWRSAFAEAEQALAELEVE